MEILGFAGVILDVIFQRDSLKILKDEDVVGRVCIGDELLQLDYVGMLKTF